MYLASSGHDDPVVYADFLLSECDTDARIYWAGLAPVYFTPYPAPEEIWEDWN